MSNNQKKAFWSMFAGFCVVATTSLQLQGGFKLTSSIVGASILMAVYLVVAYLIYLYVKKNPKEMDKWFNK